MTDRESIIFLDVDGVLNDMDYKGPGTCGCTEIDPERIRLLGRIARETHACVVLSSTWASLKPDLDEPDDPEAARMWNGLVSALRNEGIRICDTLPQNIARPNAILDWIKKHPETRHFVSIEDDYGPDFYTRIGIGRHLLQTDFFVLPHERGGLLEEHVPQAIEIMKIGNPVRPQPASRKGDEK